MLYPVPILIYVLEIAAVAYFMKNRSVNARVATAALVVVASAVVFQRLIWND